MTHKSEIVFIGGYENVSDASADYDAVAAAQSTGTTGHLEAAVVSRDPSGALALDRHARLGGIHLAHGPTDELRGATQEVARGSVALLVVCAQEDAKEVDAAAKRATARTTRAAELYRGGSGAGFAAGPPSDEVGGAPEGGYDGGVPDAETSRPEV
jgi:hypothetical protein